MKKNRMMRIASVLLVCVLLSTCAISGTFAKYTSTYPGEANAAVAKWAFEMNDASIQDDFEFNLADTVKEIGGTAESEVRPGFIAPGTEGSFTIELENLSDVVAKYTVTVAYAGSIPVTFDIDTATADIAIDGTATITVDWKWPWIETDESTHAGTDLTATVTVLLEQVN